MRYVHLILFLFTISFNINAQYQFVVVKKNDVVLRYDQGDDFIYKLRGDKKKKTGFIRRIRQDSIFLWADTVLIHELAKVYQSRRRFHNTIGSVLLIGGVSYFLIDQVNNSIVGGNRISIDESLALTSGVLTTAGVPLMYFNKRVHQRGRKFRFLITGPGSPFYVNPFF